MATAVGLATRLWYHSGFSGVPPLEATIAYSPPCSTRITGSLRTFPLTRPRMVTMITGISVLPSVFPRLPPELSYSATWSRTHWAGLGSYSPSMDMPRF